MVRRGILIVVSGFSGAGKGSLMKRITEKYGNYTLSVSATTREPRPGELEGRDYFFKTTDEFEKMIAKDELLEYAKYVDHFYGTPKANVEEELEAGHDVILEIELQGALKVKGKYPDALLLFVVPPTIAELKNRLIKRGTDSLEVIQNRLDRAKEEVDYLEQYDYLVVNDDLEDCVDQMHQIIQAEHERTSRNHEFIESIRQELKGE